MIKLSLTPKQKLFELLCIKNYVLKYFAKYLNLDAFCRTLRPRNTDTFFRNILEIQLKTLF